MITPACFALAMFRPLWFDTSIISTRGVLADTVSSLATYPISANAKKSPNKPISPLGDSNMFKIV